jgi:uncharacterized membrane protein YfcA
MVQSSLARRSWTGEDSMMVLPIARRPDWTAALAAEGYHPDMVAYFLDAARVRRTPPLKDVVASVSKTAHSFIVRLGQGFTPANLWVSLSVPVVSALLFFAAVHPHLHGLGLVAFMAVFMASLVSSIAGFAFSAICGAMLFQLLDQPVRIVQIMMVCSIAIQLLSVISLKNAIDWRHLGRLLVGGVIGLPMGIYLLMNIRPNVYLHVIGVFLIGYGLYMFVRRPASLRINSVVGDCLVGLIGGVTGGFAAFPGAFVTIWCGLKGWDKNQQRGVFQPFILIMQVLGLAAITIVQTPNLRAGAIDLLAMAYLPAALLGTWSGIAIFRRLSDLHFSLCVNALLIVSGLGLIL